MEYSVLNEMSSKPFLSELRELWGRRGRKTVRVERMGDSKYYKDRYTCELK